MKLFHKKSFLELVTPSLTVNLTEFFGRPHTPTLGHFPKYYLFFSFFFLGGGFPYITTSFGHKQVCSCPNILGYLCYYTQLTGYKLIPPPNL